MSWKGKGFPKGRDNPKWKGDAHPNERGYLRIRTRLNRNRFVHRVVVAEALKHRLCADYVFPVLEPDGLPAGYTVNHFDWNKLHNCLGNLQLLQKCIHDAISVAHQKLVRKTIKEDWEGYLEWVHGSSEPDRWE